MSASVKIREKYQVTIPEDVRSQIQLKIGDRVQVIARGNEIVIRPLVEVPKSQAWFWTSEWQKQLSQSMKDVAQGKVKVFKSVKEAKKQFGD